VSARHAVIEIDLSCDTYKLWDQRSHVGSAIGLRLLNNVMQGETESLSAASVDVNLFRKNTQLAASVNSSKLNIPSNSYLTIGELHFHFNCYYQRLKELYKTVAPEKIVNIPTIVHQALTTETDVFGKLSVKYPSYNFQPNNNAILRHASKIDWLPTIEGKPNSVFPFHNEDEIPTPPVKNRKKRHTK
jgi:hypothetical protein